MNPSVRNENAPVLHERQAVGVVHGRWHRLHYGVVVPDENRVLFKCVHSHLGSITGVEHAVVHLVHLASQTWIHADVHGYGPCSIIR